MGWEREELKLRQLFFFNNLKQIAPPFCLGVSESLMNKLKLDFMIFPYVQFSGGTAKLEAKGIWNMKRTFRKKLAIFFLTD